MAVITSETVWMDRTSFMVATINGLILLLTLIIQLYCQNKTKTLLQIKVFNLFAILTIFCSISFCVQKTFASFGIFSDSDYHCKLHVQLGALFYFSMKHAMYLCFIMRLHVAFKDSTLKFTNKMFALLYSLIIISFSTQLAEYILFGNGKLYTDYDNKNNIPYCISLCPHWTRIYNAFCDLIISVLLCVLFVKRLFKAFVLSQQFHNDAAIQVEISKIARYITLTIIGVTTTFMALILFAITTWFIWISIDIVINCYCIFLLYKANINSFNTMCGLCHVCVGYSFYKILDWKGIFQTKQEQTLTSVPFEKHSLQNKDIAILTRVSFCKAYNINYAYNNYEQNKNEILEDEEILDLPPCELITVPSQSDTTQYQLTICENINAINILNRNINK
eukprot:41363_1